MAYQGSSQYLKYLENKINITNSPFSDRGSRLLVKKRHDQSRLDIYIAERLKTLQSDLDSYQDQPAYIQDFCFTDEHGTLLDFELTSYPHALFFETLVGIFTLTFQDRDTLAIGLPKHACAGIRFEIFTPMRRKVERGSSLKSTHNLTYQATCPFVEQNISTISTGNQYELIAETSEDDALHISIQSDAGVSVETDPFSKTLRAAEHRWRAWFSKIPPVDERYLETYNYAWWVMANNLVSPRGYLKFETMMPSKAFYIGAWNWDSCFHAVALRHVDAQLARDQLRTILAWQRPDGMLPDAVHDEGIVDWIDHPQPGKVTKPPVIAWAALKIHEIAPDMNFLAEIYPAIVRWNAWWFSRENIGLGGLSQYTHPYSSGLDNNPLWDHGFPVTSPDLNTYLCVQMQSLAEMASLLGYQDDEHVWRERSRKLFQKMLNTLYDEEIGLFQVIQHETSLPELTIVNLLPLWCDLLNSNIRKQLIAHLTNPDEFWTEYPLATVARNTSSFSPEKMWRGPVWISINYIFIEALSKSGHHKLADELRERTLSLVSNNDGIFEYYNPETGAVPPDSVPMFGWSAALYIDLALQASASKN